MALDSETSRQTRNREHCEWCNLWWEQANNETLPRVLFIGDSITAGYRPLVQQALQGSACIDMCASSRAIDDPAFT